MRVREGGLGIPGFGPAVPAGFIISPITSAFIPTFPIILTHKGKSITTTGGFDTGVTGVAMNIPASMAAQLGLTDQGSFDTNTWAGSISMHKSTIDQIQVAGSKCAMRNAAITYGGDWTTPLVGNLFFNSMGGSIEYTDNGPVYNCTGGDTPVAAAASADGSGDDNTMLYVGVGAAVLGIGVLAFILL
jgi:hypothetical protein